MTTSSLGATYAPERDWTAEPASPLADPLLSLTQHGPSSFRTNDLDRFARWIGQFAFVRAPGRSPHEYGRFVRSRQLIVAYHSTTLLIQGQHVDATVRLLSTQAGDE